jgi:hypothetical protein
MLNLLCYPVFGLRRCAVVMERSCGFRFDKHLQWFEPWVTHQLAPRLKQTRIRGSMTAAYRAGAAIAHRLGFDARAVALETAAEHLRQRFENRFWCEHLSTYALALDGDGRQCQVRSSNAGHLLMAGIAFPERGRRVAKGLMDVGFFTGWGIRTLATGEARYNPMSYHNGSVWPHDNALIALGLVGLGLRADTARLLEGMQAASAAMDLRRLPELFCGFHRRPGQGPNCLSCGVRAAGLGGSNDPSLRAGLPRPEFRPGSSYHTFQPPVLASLPRPPHATQSLDGRRTDQRAD